MKNCTLFYPLTFLMNKTNIQKCEAPCFYHIYIYIYIYIMQLRIHFRVSNRSKVNGKGSLKFGGGKGV